ncbi:hypothetical protein LINGRAHAP2_LOCUS4235 [Linum grandiflorum]
MEVRNLYLKAILMQT